LTSYLKKNDHFLKKIGQVFPAVGHLKLWATSPNGQVGKKVNVKPCMGTIVFDKIFKLIVPDCVDSCLNLQQEILVQFFLKSDHFFLNNWSIKISYTIFE
jgi:hypothetical protein